MSHDKVKDKIVCQFNGSDLRPDVNSCATVGTPRYSLIVASRHTNFFIIICCYRLFILAQNVIYCL
jgi:hypothetical protein